MWHGDLEADGGWDGIEWGIEEEKKKIGEEEEKEAHNKGGYVHGFGEFFLSLGMIESSCFVCRLEGWEEESS